jgi:hypothetical protein
MAVCDKYNRDYATCLKVAVYFCVAKTNTTNFYEFFMCAHLNIGFLKVTVPFLYDMTKL